MTTDLNTFVEKQMKDKLIEFINQLNTDQKVALDELDKIKQKAQAWDLFEEISKYELIFTKSKNGWNVWSCGYIGFYSGSTPFEAFMKAYNALKQEEDGTVGND